MSHPIEAKNFLDRAIEFVSPGMAANRYAARASIEVARSMPASSYRGAIAGRAGQSFGSSTTYRGGSTADRQDLATMRSRGRRSYRENVIARSLLDSETDNVMSLGLSFQMQSKTPEFNKEAEDRFYKWLDKCDVRGKLCGSEWFRNSWKTPRKDGDGGILLARRGGYPYLQYVPGDWVCDPWHGAVSKADREQFDWKNTFDGVECEPAGRPTRFWVRDVDDRGNDTMSLVDAKDMIWLSHIDEETAVRGMTVYAPIFGLLDQLDTYIDSVTKASIMACIFGLIEKRNKPGAALAPLGTIANSEGVQQKAITLDKGGMIKVMGTAEDMVQVVPQQPMSNAPDFITAMMRQVCLAFDMPLEIGSKDLSKVNFSGGRIGLIGYYRSCRVKQDWIKSRCWNRIAFWWLSIEKQRQDFGYSDAFKTPFPVDYGEFDFHGHEWDYNSPTDEANADLIEVSLGTKSVQMACEQRGRDYGKIRKERKEQLDADRKDGIPVVLAGTTREEAIAKPLTIAPFPANPNDQQNNSKDTPPTGSGAQPPVV